MNQGRSRGVSNRRRGRRAVFAAVLAITATMAATLVITRVGANEEGGTIFRPFPDTSGRVQSATANPELDATNKFFDPGIGTNGQACVTCHQPDQGITILVPAIRDAFEDSQGLDPLFRTNDTADRPDADVSTVEQRRNAFSLFLDLGVVRIGKSVPGNANFEVEPQNTSQFGPLPNANDPQGPLAVAGGGRTLSAFRRPLVNVNVNFDSSVLWDGRATITDMLSQVQKASRGLLLSGGANAPVPTGTNGSINPAISGADAQDVVSFMTGVFTDQVFDKRAGRLNARGATGGVANLLDLASNPARPCVFSAPGVLTPFVPASCTPVPPPPNPTTMTLFDAWKDLPLEGRNANRAAVARGQEVFNNNVCRNCHATPNIGNNPSAQFFIRLGMDSVDILTQLAAQATDPDDQAALNGMVERVKKLPQYCLRPTSDPTPFSSAPCGTRPGDVKTTDPGRALVTGQIADVGKFKPPILRDLAIRAPFFHNGAAKTLNDLVSFYDARFAIGFTSDQIDDLIAFLEAL